MQYTFMINNIIKTEKQRQGWIDWVKVFGMLFIVWGHSSPKLFSDFVYTFSVPLFFIMAGYLSRCKVDNLVLGGGKIVRLLVLPYLCLCVPNIIFIATLAFLKGTFTIELVRETLLAHLIGLQGMTVHGHGCGPLWFIYTLAIIKVLCLIVNKNGMYIISALSFVLAVFFQDVVQDWAVTNTLVALPFFSIGLLLSDYKQHVNQIKTRVNNMQIVLFILIMITLACCTYLVSMANGDVKMFKCGYGNNPFFFLFGGLIGTSMLAFVSMRLDNLFSTFVSTISKGNIVILGLHFQLIRMSTSFVDSIMQEPFTRDLITLFLSGVIIICFVPIIFLIQKYIPIVIGNR